MTVGTGLKCFDARLFPGPLFDKLGLACIINFVVLYDELFKK